MRKARTRQEIQEWWIKRGILKWKELTSKGERFETEDSSGYIYKGKKHYDWKRGKTITGPDYPFPDEPIVKSLNPWAGIK